MTIEKTISAYFQNEKDIVAVYLFGSYASKKQRAMSDIDIGLIVDFDKIEAVDRRKDRFLIDLSRELRKDVHLVMLNRSTEELLAQVFKKGKCVLVNKPRELSSYRTNMYARIADFSYYKEIMQSGFVNKVMGAGGIDGR